MKRFRVLAALVPLLVLGLLSATLSAQASVFMIEESNSHEIVLQISSPRPSIETVRGTTYSRISLENAVSSAVDGAPDLPLFGAMLAIPANASYTVSYRLSDPISYTGVKPAPVEDASKDMKPSPLFYSSEKYPSEQVVAASDAWIRDYRVLPLQACPFSWDPIQNTLTHYGSIRAHIALSYPPNDGGAVPYTTDSAAFRQLYEAQILNYAAMRDPLASPQSPRVLIIHGAYSDATFNTKLGEFVAWKRQKGFEVNVASTAVTGTSNTAIKSYIQGMYDAPATRPDFIILIGDVNGSFPVPTWYETDSGFNGATDYPYTFLSGNDMLGDAFIGRMSAENLAQLITLFSKVYTYEKNVNTTLPYSGWMNRMLIIGDPTYSGQSCVYTGHFIHDIAQQAHPEYEFIEQYDSGYVSAINSGINQGVGFFAYRGYYEVSGWSPSSALTNGFKLPHSVIITCGTGMFDGTTLTEEFIRMGTESVPAGAATSIGMSTTHTHTLFNNALIAGIMNGVFTHRMRTMGEALLQGRIYLHNVYSAALPDRVKAHAQWCNLMGDPTLEAWVGIPKVLSMNVPASIPAGTGVLEIGIADASGSPLQDVCVTAYSTLQNTVVAKAFTGINGIAVLELPSTLEQSILITASAHDIKPAQSTISIDPAGSLCHVSHQVMDNGNGGSTGNGDGLANAWETIALDVALRNSTQSSLSGLTASLAIDNPNVSIIQSGTPYPDMAAGSTASGSQPFLISLGGGIAPIEGIRCVLTVSAANAQTYQSVFYLQATNARLDVAGFVVSDGANGILDAGETCTLNLQISNAGACSVLNIQGELRALDNLVTVTDSLAWFGDIANGSEITCLDGFQVRARGWLVAGMQVPMRLRLYNFAGFEQICLFSIPVGSVAQNTPLGPDAYGYLIYDDTDTAFADCPVYDWMEIAPSLGGAGTELNTLADSGSGSEGETNSAHPLEVVNLPFPFKCYGIEYNQITVCVNGFITMGVTGNADFRNVWLPGEQGAFPMIAPFWDDLYMPTSAGVYQFYDTTQHRFIIQYNNLKNKYDRTSLATFQVIFYDPLYHHSGLGDGIIKIQYKEFHNVDAGGSGDTPFHGNYCTIGIKDHTNTRGLTYSFNNTYAQAAAPLGNERDILITTVPAIQQQANLLVEDVIVHDANDSILVPGESAEIGILLRNAGLASATGISASFVSTSPWATVSPVYSEYPDIQSTSSAVNRTPFVVSVADSCPDGTLLSFQCQVTHASGSKVFPVILIVRRTALTFNGFTINDALSSGNGILEPGEQAMLVLNFRNTSLVPATGLAASITTTNPHVTLLDSNFSIAYIPPLSTVQASVRVSLSTTAPVGTSATLNIAYSIDQGTAQNAQINVRIGSTGLYHNFEELNGNFIPVPSTNAWQWGVSPSVGAHSGTKVWGTLLEQQYPNDVSWILTSQPTYLGSNNFLEFWYYCDTQSGIDGGNVQISVNNAAWTLIDPLGGYPSASVAALGTPGYSGSIGWTKALFDLSPYANRNVIFRWTFASDASTQGMGMYIDDVCTFGISSFAGQVAGHITVTGAGIEPGNLRIGNQSGCITTADALSNYSLFLPAGTHILTAEAEGYLSQTSAELVVGLQSPSLNQDFQLIEFKPVEGFTTGHNEHAVQIYWEPPQQPFFPITGYRIERRLNAGAFDTTLVTAEPYYSEVLIQPGRYQYRVRTLYSDGQSLPSQTYSVEYPFSPAPDTPPVPLVTSLHPNYPNPFNPSTVIAFDLATPGKTVLRVFNLRGQLVNTLCHKELGIGTHSFVWDGMDASGRRVASGMYFYRLEAPGYIATRKMLLMK